MFKKQVREIERFAWPTLIFTGSLLSGIMSDLRYELNSFVYVSFLNQKCRTFNNSLNIGLIGKCKSYSETFILFRIDHCFEMMSCTSCHSSLYLYVQARLFALP